MPHTDDDHAPHLLGPFLPGLDLCRALYTEAVRPLLDRHYPGLPHAAARIGSGSEVLGFDSARSTDHEWGPRLTLFLSEDDLAEHGGAIHRMLAEHLPSEIRGWPVHYQRGDNPNDPVAHLARTDGPRDHRVGCTTVPAWLRANLGADPLAGPLTANQWLALPQQRLAEATAGAVFHDGPGHLTRAREELAWYPSDVWRFLLASQWMRIGQEEAFTGRTAEAGDELGSRLVAARQAREIVRLALLQSRRYAPYTKWLGSAFTRDVPDAAALEKPLLGALAATDFGTREACLGEAYQELARRHNALGLTEPLDPDCRPYYGRPYQVIHAERFGLALWASITDPSLRRRQPIGAADQWADSTDLLSRPAQPVVEAALAELDSPRAGRWLPPEDAAPGPSEAG